MFKKICYVLALSFCIPVFAQVGIGTENPTATLDINGTLRIRQISQETDMEIAKDSILVVSRNGMVNRVAAKVVLNSVLRTAVKGNFSGNSTVGLPLGAGSTYTTLPFDNEEFDYNDEYDPATYTFTAKQNGIYTIMSQINSDGGLGASSDYGLCVLKNGAIISKENYANITVTVLLVDLNVTPPIRKSNTVVQLNMGDTINFQLFSDLAFVDLSGNPEDSYFSIIQIR